VYWLKEIKMQHGQLHDTTIEIAKLTPPITVSTLTFFGMPLSTMAQLLTIGYTLIMIFFFLYDRYKKHKAEKNAKAIDPRPCDEDCNDPFCKR